MQKILSGIINIIIVMHVEPFLSDSYCSKSATSKQKVDHVGTTMPVGGRPASFPQER